MFWHPNGTNPRIFSTPILILRDHSWPPSRKLESHKWTIVPGVLSRNASPYQMSFSGEIKSCGVKMIHHSADWGWSKSITSKQRRATCGGAHLWWHMMQLPFPTPEKHSFRHKHFPHSMLTHSIPCTSMPSDTNGVESLNKCSIDHSKRSKSLKACLEFTYRQDKKTTLQWASTLISTQQDNWFFQATSK